MPKRQHMEQMTAGMMSYFLSISKLQSTSTVPAPVPSGLNPVGSAIAAESVGVWGRPTLVSEVKLLLTLSQVHQCSSPERQREERQKVCEFQST